MFILIIPGAITAILGVIMTLPPMRRRAQNRGFSGFILVPAMLAGFGLVCLLVGFIQN